MGDRVAVGRLTKKCETCAADVTRKASAFRERVYCSRRCYLSSPYHSETVAAANARRHPVDSVIIRQCEQCGSDVRRPRSQYRNRTFCSLPCRTANRVRSSRRQITPQGYAKIFVGAGAPGADKSGHILEHRQIVQDLLGRPLLLEENVHHKNGIRDDNRPENLELWTRSQPAGQRVTDKIAWARELLARYEGVDIM